MKVMTIGSSSQCDVVLNINNTYVMEQIKPVHCQIIQDDNGNFRLIPFSEYIYVNNCGINAPLSKLHKIDDEFLIDIEDSISIGIGLFWQQWFAGFGLNCENCKYKKYSLQNDEWCDYCKNCKYIPRPYIWGYSRNFRKNDMYEKDVGYFNYASCDNCSFKPDWCCECTFFFEPEYKDRSPKAHIEMYNERIREYEKVSNTRK